MDSGERTSHAIARAELPASWISRATVLIVDCGELGSGGNLEAGMAVVEASEVVLAETTTVGCSGNRLVDETRRGLLVNEIEMRWVVGDLSEV